MVKLRSGFSTKSIETTGSSRNSHKTDKRSDLNMDKRTDHTLAQEAIMDTVVADQGASAAQVPDSIPQQPPKWFTEVNQKLDKIISIDHRLASIERKFMAFDSEIRDMRESIDFACNEASQANNSVVQTTKKVSSLEEENEKLKKELIDLKLRTVMNESQSRRNNLLFHGIIETAKESWQDCEKAVSNVLKKDMNISEDIKFERVHRIGYKTPNNARSIIVKFNSFKDREQVWSQRKKLSKLTVRISEDYPTEILEERKVLYPIFIAAKNCDQVTSTSLKVNKLHINGKVYTTKNLYDLPEHLQPKSFATKQQNGVVLFSSRYSLLSNFYSESPISVKGKSYCSTEQYYQHTKALHFEDDLAAKRIMDETDPLKIHNLGKRIRNYNEKQWETRASQVLYEANIAKFQQLPDAKQALLSTESDRIGEATLDPEFGIGLRITDKAALDSDKWTGKNRFGMVLEQIRSELRAENK